MKITRRQLLLSIAGSTALSNLRAARHRFRLAICNETFQDYSFSETCRAVRRTGYAGLEIAPFTLSEDPAALPATRLAELRDLMTSEGVQYVGLHSLLTAPEGLHITTPDTLVRRRSWEYFRRLIDLSAGLGAGGVMVLGSAKQRRAVGGSSVADAERRLQEGLSQLAADARATGVTILLEPLAPHLCDVVNSLDRAIELVKQINHPAVQTMFDTHGAVAEKLPHDRLLKTHFKYIWHVHVNEMDGRHPGTGAYDFKPVLQALKDLSYDRWISVEVFDFSPGGEFIARESERFIRKLEAQLT